MLSIPNAQKFLQRMSYNGGIFNYGHNIGLQDHDKSITIITRLNEVAYEVRQHGRESPIPGKKDTEIKKNKTATILTLVKR